MMNPLWTRARIVLAAVTLVTALVSGGAAVATISSDGGSSVSQASAPVVLPEPFTSVQAFATKTGFRGVVSWSTTTPIVPVVRYGTEEGNLDQLAPVVDTPDTAGMAVIGLGTDDTLAIGETYYVTIEDQLTGAITPAIPFEAKNAYNDYAPNTEQPSGEVSRKEDVYTLDLLVQLDAQALPDDISPDQGLEDLANGINVFAERLYDAMDGYARVGNVLITDTNVAGLGSTPGATVVHSPGTCDAPGNVADVLVTTAMPFDSHTFAYAVAEPCTPFYLGREGQLVVPWEDDLHLGYTATHEMMHYAFGAPDLYGNGDVTGVGGGGCKEPSWDGSVMHNSGGWKTDQWELTEVDRNLELTPCDHGSEPYTWATAQDRYLELPDPTAPEDVHNTIARGNPDGGALNISILDREPGASTLQPFTPIDSNVANPCPATPGTSTTFTDDPGDATSILGLANAPAETNAPALDLLGEQTNLNIAQDALTLKIDVGDLQETPPSASVGEWFDIAFAVDGRPLEVVAEWDRTAGVPTYTLNEFDGGRTAIAPVTGDWSVDDDFITVTVPASVTPEGGSPYTVFGPGSTIRSFETTSRRVTGLLVPDADVASGGCPLGVDGTPPTSGGVDATLDAATTTYEFDGAAATGVETFVQGPVELTGSTIDEHTIQVNAAGQLSATVQASPTSYATISISNGSGKALDARDAPVGQSATATAPVIPGLYKVTVSYLVAVESTYHATVHLEVGSGPSGTPDGVAPVSKATGASFAGASPADNVDYECTGPFDPLCRTYAVDVSESGDLLASVESALTVDDFDLAMYDSAFQEVASGGLPGTPPGGLESVTASVAQGRYYIVVQPYAALEDTSTFTLTVSLS